MTTFAKLCVYGFMVLALALAMVVIHLGFVFQRYGVQAQQEVWEYYSSVSTLAFVTAGIAIVTMGSIIFAHILEASLWVIDHLYTFLKRHQFLARLKRIVHRDDTVQIHLHYQVPGMEDMVYDIGRKMIHGSSATEQLENIAQTLCLNFSAMRYHTRKILFNGKAPLKHLCFETRLPRRVDVYFD